MMDMSQFAKALPATISFYTIIVTITCGIQLTGVVTMAVKLLHNSYNHVLS